MDSSTSPDHLPTVTSVDRNMHPALAVVDGWGVTIATLDAAVDAALTAARARRPTSLVTLNLDHLVKLRHDERFRHAYRSAAIVTADGAPIVWLARMQGVSLTRATGADIVLPIARGAAAADLPIALFGTSDSVIAAAARSLRQSCGPTLRIVHCESPPMGFDPTGPEADAALDRMVAAGASLCFIALGAPKQELMAACAVDRGLPITCVSIGAALDFIAGRVSRAPVFIQKTGLEWAWRLASEPRRLFWRYARCAAILVDLAVVQPALRRLGRGQQMSPR